MSRRSKPFPRFLLAVVLALGFALVVPVVIGVPALFFAGDWVGFNRPDHLSDKRALVGYTDEGQPVLGQLVPVGDNGVTLACFDLAGNPVETQPWFAIEMPEAPGPSGEWRSRLVGWGGSTVSGTSSGPWFLVADGNAQGYLVEIPQETAEPTRYLGSAGLRREPIPPEERFQDLRWVGYPSSPPPKALLSCETRLYLVDLTNAEVHTLLADLKSPLRGSRDKFDYARPYALTAELKVPRGMDYRFDTPTSHTSSSQITDGGRSMPGDVILCNDEMLCAITFADLFGKQKLTTKTFPLPAAVAGGRFSFALRTGGGLTVAIPELPEFGVGTGAQQIYLVEADGTVGSPRRVEVPGGAPEQRERPWQIGLIFASPLAQAIEIATSGTRSWHDYAGMSGPGDYALQLLWRDRRLMIGTGAIGVVLALACLRRQRRYRQRLSEQILWPLFVLVLGLPGWVGYRFSRRWPVLEACESCHQRSPRDAEVCAACAAEFPLPALQGTEIFA